MKKYPIGQYGRQRLTFHPAPFRSPLRAFAVLVFPWSDGKVLLCDIFGRGWSVPSGRVEPNESSLEAAVRETKEEAGAELDQIQYIGSYQIFGRREVRWADCFTARVAGLVEISAHEESKGREFFEVEQLPATYHVWNSLTEMVFNYSREVLERGRAGN